MCKFRGQNSFKGGGGGGEEKVRPGKFEFSKKGQNGKLLL